MRLAFMATVLLFAARCGAAPHPDLSGFWNLDLKVPRDPQLMGQVAPDITFIDDKWDVSATGSNLLNKALLHFGVRSDTSVGAGADFAVLAPPREWSVQVEHKF